MLPSSPIDPVQPRELRIIQRTAEGRPPKPALGERTVAVATLAAAVTALTRPGSVAGLLGLAGLVAFLCSRTERGQDVVDQLQRATGLVRPSNPHPSTAELQHADDLDECELCRAELV